MIASTDGVRRGRLATSPTQRTLDWLRKRGFRAAVVEKWIAQRGVRLDLFNVGDILAFDADSTVMVQCFSTGWSEHADKVKEHADFCAEWIRPGREFWFIGWRKLKVKRGGLAMRWFPRFGIVRADATVDEVDSLPCPRISSQSLAS